MHHQVKFKLNSLIQAKPWREFTTCRLCLVIRESIHGIWD